jgi:hypothetical protein
MSPRIHTLNDSLNYDTYYQPTFKFGYTLHRQTPQSHFLFFIKRYILNLLEYLFLFFKYLSPPPNHNNIMRVHEIVEVIKGSKIIYGRVLLDTGNESLTIITNKFFKCIEIDDNDVIWGNDVVCLGITGVEEKMKTVFLNWRVCGFYHQGFVAISTRNNTLTDKYEMILSQHDISKMYHSNFHFCV